MAKTTTKTTKQTPLKVVPKQETKKPEPPKNLPAPVKKQEPVTYDEEMLREMQADIDAGHGVSTAVEDNIVPLIYILQPLSPQVLRQKAEYIEGAQAGNFWFRGTRIVVDGDEGIPVVVCHLSTKWIEWSVERGAGSLRGRYDVKPAEAKWTPDPKDPRVGKWMMPSGDTYVAETKEVVVLLPETGEAYVLPCSGTNIGAARGWNTSMQKRLPGSTLKSMYWTFVWRLKTIAKSNDKGDWFGLKVEEELDEENKQKTSWFLDGGATYRRARQLAEDFDAGVKQSDQGEEEYDDSDSEQEDDENSPV